MGNCLVIQGRKEIKVVSIDGEILKALPPSPSKGALAGSDADELPAYVQRHLDPAPGDTEQMYSLLPAAAKAPSSAADPGAVVRVKLVISKQELRRMLGKDQQAVSLDDMVALMRRESEEQEQESCRGWRPALHSIPEDSSDLY